MGSGWNVLQILWLVVSIAGCGLSLVGGWLLVREVLRFARPEPQPIAAPTQEPEGTS